MSASLDGLTAIHIRSDAPEGVNELFALAIHAAISFCAEPETFPVFQAHAVAITADSSDWAAKILASTSPEVMRDIATLVAAGVVADLEDAEVTP